MTRWVSLEPEPSKPVETPFLDLLNERCPPTEQDERICEIAAKRKLASQEASEPGLRMSDAWLLYLSGDETLP